jgi:hypothetical protein
MLLPLKYLDLVAGLAIVLGQLDICLLCTPRHDVVADRTPTSESAPR